MRRWRDVSRLALLLLLTLSLVASCVANLPGNWGRGHGNDGNGWEGWGGNAGRGGKRPQPHPFDFPDLPHVMRPNFSASSVAPAAFGSSSGAQAEDLPEEPFLEATKVEDLPCTPEDFVRTNPRCEDLKLDHKIVNYVNLRRCKPVFDITSHNEPCGCGPDDYIWGYQKRGEQCHRVYFCLGQEPGSFQVEDVHCQLMRPTCQAGHLQTLYGKCDYIRDKKTGHKISEKQAVEVIYYFNADCDPDGSGAIRPPASAFIPCDTQCGGGSFLFGTQCKKCQEGTYSLGGVVRYEHFETIDPSIFETSCEYQRLLPGSKTQMETVNCTQGWYAEDFALEVGQFDFVNQWFPDECQADPNKDCHNNLQAVLGLHVDLVMDGYVKFNFSVNAEKEHDGLLFYVDTFEQPRMHLQSYQVVPKAVTFMVAAGRHTLYWVYSKNARFTQGEDIAVIHFIEVGGMAYNAFKCLECPAGFTSKAGAVECETCPINHFNTYKGAAGCDPCKDDEFSVSIPRTKCFPKQPCNLTRDYVRVKKGCEAKTRTQAVKYVPTTPSVCQGGDPMPPDTREPCAPCHLGFEEFVDTNVNLIRCRECPSGTARDETQDKCTPCKPGSYAPKEFSFRGYDSGTGRPPPFVTSYCSGACGTTGWRMMTGFMDSGRHHGDDTQVFLMLHAILDGAGTVWFNYSVDMSAGPKKRGFYFYIDDNIMDFVQDDNGGSITPDDVRESGPWDLEPGHHTIVWEWQRISDDAPPGARDSAIIYDFTIQGSKFGYSSHCETVPPGFYYNSSFSHLEPCPPGTFSPGGATSCTPCADNSISGPKSESCTPCGPGTSSNSGDSECFIGSVNDKASFCTYFDTSNAPTDFTNATQSIHFYFYDLTPLNRLSTVRPFGPVREHDAEPGHSSVYYLNICNRDYSNATCFDSTGKPLNTFACQVRSDEAVQLGHKPSVDLGKSIAIYSLAEQGKGLGGRGVTLSFAGDTCAKTRAPSTMNLTLICSPDSGYGLPTHWTSDGKRAAYDLSLTAPREWVVRTGAALPIEDPETCFHDLVWYSKVACHECTSEDYEEVRVNDCKDNKLYTYRWKQDLACLPTKEAPLPSDIICQPCTEADYTDIVGVCADIMGTHNITYSWSQPKVCSSSAEGAAQLPVDVLAGPCVQEFLFVPSKYLSPKYVFIFALLGVLLVVMLVIFLVAWIKHRRIKKFYSKLVESEEQNTEMVDLDDDSDEHARNGEQRHLQG